MSPGVINEWLNEGVAGLLLAALGVLAIVIRYLWKKLGSDQERFDAKMAERDTTIKTLMNESNAQLAAVVQANTEAFRQSGVDFSQLVAAISRLIEAIEDQDKIQQRQGQILTEIRKLTGHDPA